MDPKFAPFSKTERFERDLSEKLAAGDFKNEHELAEFCYDRGMRPKHCSTILKRLKDEGVLQADFLSPQMSNNPPREITILVLQLFYLSTRNKFLNRGMLKPRMSNLQLTS